MLLYVIYVYICTYMYACLCADLRAISCDDNTLYILLCSGNSVQKMCRLPKGVEIVVKSAPFYTVEVRSENAEKDLIKTLSRLQAVFKDQGMEIKRMR